MNRSAILRQRIEAGEMTEAIGAHDALSARLVERAGFNAIYVGSYATEATFLESWISNSNKVFAVFRP